MLAAMRVELSNERRTADLEKFMDDNFDITSRELVTYTYTLNDLFTHPSECN